MPITGKRKSGVAINILPDRPMYPVNSDLLFYHKPTKFAPVAPARIYKSMIANGYRPEQILLLAHDVAVNQWEFVEIREELPKEYTTIILDNSVVELKKAVDTPMIEEAALASGADIVVLPDVMGKSIESFEATQEVYEDWKWRFRDRKLMALIQGETIVDWLNCAEMLEAYCPTPWIGIPRCAEGIKNPKTGKVYSRYELVELATAIMPDAKIHLFGFSDYIWEDLIAATHPKVESIDSTVPLRLETKMILSEDAGPRGDWWETVKFDRSMIERCHQVDKLITRL